MLRINLLPSYVTQRRLTKRLVPVFIFLFALSVAAPLTGYFYLHSKLTTLTQQANDAVSGKAITDSLKADAVTTLGQVAPIQAKLQFVDAVNAYILKWIALYNRLADTTPKSSFIYTGAQVTGPTMAIKAYTPSVEEVGRYLQVMYHEPDFLTVAVDKIPAYPDNIRHFYYLDGVMVFADGATGSASDSGGGRGGFSGGMPGGRSGFPGGNPGGRGGFPGSTGGAQGGGQAASGGPTNWTPDALGPNGPTNIPVGVGPPPPELTGGVAAAAGTGSRQGLPGGAQGQGQAGGAGTYSPNFLRVAGRLISPFASPEIRDQLLRQQLHRVVVKTVPKGFDINVTATLKEPLTPPDLPGSAPAAGTAPGGPGGFPGGMPGGPGGMRGMPGGPGSMPGGPPTAGRPA
ncbi:MAG: PilN domain-containing protein [Janthinobacterium lividum]